MTSPGENVFVTNIRRLVVRSAFGSAYYPLSRFQRMEAGVRFANVDDAILKINEPYNPSTGFATDDPFLETDNLPGVTYAQPSAALVFDNSLFGYVGPFYGRRYRFELARTVGDWSFAQVTADYRRYDRIIGPIVFASRLLYFGRIGRDAREFRIFAGSTDLIRGNTSGSYRRNECLNANDPGSETGCSELDRLVGTQIGVASAELRFPILNPSFGIPAAIPPIEGAIFYDIGLAWDDASTHPVAARGGRRSGPRPDPASHPRLLRTNQPVRVRCGAAGLFHPAGASAGKGPLDVQPGPDVLGRSCGRRPSSATPSEGPSHRHRDRVGRSLVSPASLPRGPAG